tara:strand:+ start:197 stop:604 length:408 start_codon:yes stop_codon:yes gene_type:complete
MSTLKVNTIQDASGGNSSTAEQIAQGRAKAWVNFNGTGTVAIRDSFNVSSITDHSTGNYTTTFSNALANANYAAVGGHGGTDGSTIRMADQGPNLNSGGFSMTHQTTTSLRFLNGIGGNSVPKDASYVTIVIFAD